MSLIAHDKQAGHAYPGVNTDIFIIKCLWYSTYKPPEDGNRAAWIPIAAVGTIVYGIDIPFSFVLDTLLLPIAIMGEGDPDSRASLMTSCDKQNEEEKPNKSLKAQPSAAGTSPTGAALQHSASGSAP